MQAHLSGGVVDRYIQWHWHREESLLDDTATGTNLPTLEQSSS